MVVKKKEANLELLRSVAMMMVIALHFIGKAKLITYGEELNTSVSLTAYVIESLCIVAVNTYMLISGYFLSASSFKLSRLLKLWLQLEFYSVVIGLLGYFLGCCPDQELGIYFLLQLFFPVSMEHYWFLSAYIYLYILTPVLCLAVKKMTKEQMGIVNILLIFTFSIVKSVLPFRFNLDKFGYDVIWYICVFMVAAYIRRFGISFFNKKSAGLFVYFICTVLIVGIAYAINLVYLKTGSLDELFGWTLEYNHILVLISSIGLFSFFKNISISDKISGFICFVGKYTLGVYLLHENLGVRYFWQPLFKANTCSNGWEVLYRLIFAIVVVFTLGIIVDYVRDKLFYLCHKLMTFIPPYKKAVAAVEKVDGYFKEK